LVWFSGVIFVLSSSTHTPSSSTIPLLPETGYEIPPGINYLDLRDRAEAACNTVKLLEENGLLVNSNDEDNDVASALLTAYAKDVEATSKTVSHSRTADLTPACLVQTHMILKEFGQLVATHAAEVRNLVVNKLILETDNDDARIRVKALELLGRMTEIGLFTERKEVVVTHQNATQLREKLKERLQGMRQNAEGVYEVAETQ
jgi:hypothetical protein